MPAKKEVSQQNEKHVTEPKLPTSVSEGDDLQKPDLQRSDDLQEASSQPGEPTYEVIAMRAYELWIENGRLIGFHEDDWSRAEQELQAQGAQEKSKGASASS